MLVIKISFKTQVINPMTENAHKKNQKAYNAVKFQEVPKLFRANWLFLKSQSKNIANDVIA